MVKSPELSDVSDRTKCSADQEKEEEEEAEARRRADKAKHSVWDVGGGAWVGVSQRGDEKKKKASTTEKEECNVSSSGPGQTPPAGE